MLLIKVKKVLDKIKILVAFFVALIMLSLCIIVFNKPTEQNNITITPPDITMETTAIKKGQTINVNLGDKTVKMDMEEYIICVVAGEIYPTYLPEAIKAQAVAARTYLMYKISGGGCNNGGDICTESTHCQAYKSNEKMLLQWGNNYENYYSAIKDAVYQTKGEIVKYNGNPICALYHSSSVGKTENCVEVFGGNQPYLQSVTTTVSEENNEFTKTITFSKQDFLKKVNEAFSTDLKQIDIKIISYTSAGRVSNLKIGEKTVKATALRKALGLRSTDFTFEKTQNEITFTMKGYGHGVGLSQVGAQEMAKEGKNYKEILTHYYTGTVVDKI
ncbi:MAG: stage II sporulation protein D [Clostridiales bacterium]|nr:stage II sporulation protein D [Clostridiales bacterium]